MTYDLYILFNKFGHPLNITLYGSVAPENLRNLVRSAGQSKQANPFVLMM